MIIMNEEEKKIFKAAVKEANKEWMDEKFTEFGKWSVNTIMVASLGALAWFVFVFLGTHK